MTTSAQFGKYAATAASAVVEEISERIHQLTCQIRELQHQSRHQSQQLLASISEQDLTQLRLRIQAHYQEILRLEKEKARRRNRDDSYLSVVLSVATCRA